MIMNNKLKIINKKNSLLVDRHGFTLLFSLLILTIVLSASLGIYNIVARQLKISQISRESSLAFSAADAGMECALYWDVKEKEFDNTNYAIDCLSQNKAGSMAASTTSFYLDFNNGACVKIDVDKTVPSKTTITSYGYSNGSAASNCSSSGVLQVERVLRANY